MKAQITNYIRAGYPGLYIVSAEESRVEAMMKEIAQSLKDPKTEKPYSLFAWSVTDGLVDTGDGSSRDAGDPLQLISLLDDLPERSLVVLRDFHLFIEEANPILLRALKDVLLVGKTKAKHIAVLACRFALPPELEREFVVVNFALPGKQELGVVLDTIAESARQAKPKGQMRDGLLDAACGLTTIEAENAFALSVVENGKLTANIVAREKASEVKKNGLLEIYSDIERFEDIGGLEELKSWLLQREHAFGKEAEAYKLPIPKGLLIVGIPGTGKSLTAKATASVFDLPLLKLDVGRLFASLVGQSENNLRSVIATVEAIAPCILWCDELEKGFAGTKSSGASDGGTAARVFGSFISWMQDKKSPVFIVATANDVTQLPPELLRKGRFDEIFFVDLPNQTEREAIWKIQVAKHGRDPKKFDCEQLALATEGFTGSEIESVFIAALFEAFSNRKEPNDLTIAQVLVDFVPLSKLMAEQISTLRNWVKGRARLATKSKQEDKGRKILAAN